MDLDHPAVPGRALRGQPHPHRASTPTWACTWWSAGVIFVDLSLAQIAALGATIAILLPFTGRRSARARGSTGSAWPSRSSARRSSRPSAPPRAHPAGGHHRHLLRGGLRGLHPGHEQGHLGERAPQGHAGRQHPGRVLGRGAQDGRALRRGRRLPLRLPPAVPGHLDGPRTGRGRRASTCAAGTSSSTRPSASW